MIRFLQILGGLLLICLLSLAMIFPPEWTSGISDSVKGQLPSLVAFYHDLHAHPELSLRESKTAQKLSDEMRRLGFEVTQGVGGTGIVAILRNGEGPTILVRTDMDALPITERTGLEYASNLTDVTDAGQESGLMHACGHDMHMTVWTGTARTLVEMKDQWSGTLMMIGQPAEEIGAGAKAMIEDGLFQRFGVPDYGIALHCAATLEAGKISFAKGYAMANVNSAKLTVYGQGGHGAYPHATIDPAVLTSMIVMDLQTIVSRNVKPTDAAVVTVGSIHGGTAGNIIGDKMELQLTLRSYKEEVRTMLIRRIEEIAHGNAAAMGLPEELYPELEVKPIMTPAVYNEPSMLALLQPTWGEILGEENVIESESVMGGEDFGRYGLTEEDVPITMFWLGTIEQVRKQAAVEAGEKLPGLHSPFYYPDPEKTIETGVTAMSSAVLKLMSQ